MSSLKRLLNNINTQNILIFSFLFLILLIYIDSTYSFIGRGDYANYSNVGRNLAEGKGFNVDYIAFHYIKYPDITHPEDMWPILQPVWIAISFLIFGISPFAARLPNALFFTLLVITTYFVGKKVIDETVGLWAAVLTALNVSLIRYSTDWITSDMALALFSLLVFYLGYLTILEAKEGKVSLKKLFLMGILSGLAILQKPMGILLPVIYFLFIAYFYRTEVKNFFKPALVFIISTLIPSGPFFIHNLITFHTPFLPNEHYMGFLIKYFPYEKIFSIYYNNPPGIQTWLHYGVGNFLKVNFSYFRYSIDTFVFKDLLMPYSVIILSLVGLGLVKGKIKYFFYPAVVLFILMSVLMATYWHYESRYYAMLIPIFNLLAAYAVLKLFPKINFRAGIILAVLGFITFLPPTKALLEAVKTKPADPSQIAYTWIKDNTPKNAVIMTLSPWELNFVSERKAVMIPNEDKTQILWTAKKYHVNYLELEFLKEIKRPDLEKLYQGENTSEFSKIYSDPSNVYVYKINWDKVSLDENSKPGWY